MDSKEKEKVDSKEKEELPLEKRMVVRRRLCLVEQRKERQERFFER